jgi:RNA polymerase sigma-70 factor (ECF subfamily)
LDWCTQPQITVVPGIYERDQALADAVYRKDRKATADFVQQHADGLYAYVFSHVRPNVADAEDLTQEVFLAACRGIGGYRGASSLKAWLFGIARHKVEDYYRAKVRDADLEEADGNTAGCVELDSALDRHQLQEQIVMILDHLPAHYRLLLKWRYWDQKRTNEIAAALDRTPKAVERMLARAREHFRREWEAKP